MSIPEYAEWGYQDDVYDRYISYEQATLGLGRLTDEFPLPAGFTTNTVDERRQSDIEIYPNPTGDKIFISTISPDRIQVFDLSGRLLSEVANQNVIDMSRESPGMYLLKVWNNGFPSITKVIKQ